MRQGRLRPLDEVRQLRDKQQERHYIAAGDYDYEAEIKERLGVVPVRFREASTELPFPEQGLYLWGPVGVGKTHTAAGLALVGIEAGLKCRWITGSSWLAAIRASFNGGPAPQTPEELGDCDLLVIDDLGAEKASEWAVEQLYTLVNLAYEADAQLIVTSNLRLRDLDKRLGQRVTSRLAEVCEVVHMEGPDRRLIEAAKRQAAKR